jgi:uncharacterized phage-associated protein
MDARWGCVQNDDDDDHSPLRGRPFIRFCVMMTDYNARKAAQVIAYFASKSPTKRLHIVNAVKLVYLADRESISRYGFPIIDEDRVSMPRGPVNSTTYRYINGECEDPEWSEILRDRSNHMLSLKPNAPIRDWDELSDADIECLNAVWDKFGSMDRWDLVEWTHQRKNVPEWEDPNGSSSLIPLQRIMTMLELEDADKQADLVDQHRRLERIFASLRK